MGYIDGVCIGAVHDREKAESSSRRGDGTSDPIRMWGCAPGVIVSNVSDFKEGFRLLLKIDGAAERIRIRFMK